MYKVEYKSHTKPIFYELKTLNIFDIIEHKTALLMYNAVAIRPAAGRILTKPGMMTFLVCFMRRLIRVICLLTRVS